MAKISAASLAWHDKYKKENVVNVALQFNRKTEPELTEYVLSLPNKTGYVKGLIRADANIGANSWTLVLNDEDEQRSYALRAHTESDAVEEANQIICLFSGWMKARIDKTDWHIEDKTGRKTYLFKAE